MAKKASATIPGKLGASLVGKVTPPTDLTRGTTLFGNAMHERIANWLEAKYPNVRFEFRIAPSQNGVDVKVLAGNPGFKFADIKPRNTAQKAKLASQVEKWKSKGIIGPNDKVQPITYDSNGDIYFGF